MDARGHTIKKADWVHHVCEEEIAPEKRHIGLVKRVSDKNGWADVQFYSCGKPLPAKRVRQDYLVVTAELPRLGITDIARKRELDEEYKNKGRKNDYCPRAADAANGGENMETISIEDTIKYIEDREKTLSKYSDKLRKELARIFRIFGSNSECRICTSSENSHGKSGQADHDFKPRIPLSLKYRDNAPFYASYNNNYERYEYYLATNNSQLVIQRRSLYMGKETTEYYNATEVSRIVLVALVKSGRLPIFLHDYSNKLNSMALAMEEIAIIAERMAEAAMGD